MKSIINQIESLDKQEAKDFKFIAELSLQNTMEHIVNKDEMERLCAIIESIIFSCKQRVKEIASAEMENEFNNN